MAAEMSTTSAISELIGEPVAGGTFSSPPFHFTFNFNDIMASVSNATTFLHPSPKDLFMAIPRMLTRLASITLENVPDHLFRHGNGGSVIAEATGNGVENLVSAALSQTPSAQETIIAQVGRTAVEDTQGGVPSHSFSFQQMKTLGGIFTYMTSKWALTCFSLVRFSRAREITRQNSYAKPLQAIIINRTLVYASPRRAIRLGFPLRLALRIVPIVAFVFHIKQLLEAIRCQTSPSFSTLKYGKPGQDTILDFAGDEGLLYQISSTLLFWQADPDSCQAVRMIPFASDSADRKGSLALLWPLFQSLCLSQFVETLSCAVQGRQVLTETGMSIFEHSLAFAEAEAIISNQLGLSPFGLPKVNGGNGSSDDSGPSEVIEYITKNVWFQRLNTPPEVLLMGLISSLNHLSSQILGVFNMQGRFRLVNTGVWGLCFMSSFIWGFWSYSSNPNVESVVLRFPTVCIIGFIPHLLILIGICVCACVYLLALLLCVFSSSRGSPRPMSLMQRLKMAHQNLQATSQFSGVHLHMHEDFYTALFKTGFAVLTVASEAVYLNEGQNINVSRWTWLEEQRMHELENSRLPLTELRHETGGDVTTVRTQTEAHGQRNRGSRTRKRGYAAEMTSKTLKSGTKRGHQTIAADGVGALQRRRRYLMAWKFFIGVFWLLMEASALSLNKALDVARVSRRPDWLKRSRSKKQLPEDGEMVAPGNQTAPLEFWLLTDDGLLSLPENDDVDVESETKKRLMMAHDQWGEDEERTLDSTLYRWWTHGGWWGERDESGEYRACDQDDDTSVTSASTSLSEADGATDDEDGRTTPTQRQPYRHSRSGTPVPTRRKPYPRSRSTSPTLDHALDPSHLARLLAPKDVSDRHEAHMLAHRLTSDHVITRATYRRAQALETAHVLTSTRYRPAAFPTGKLAPAEEAELLEQLIISRRATSSASPPLSSSSPSSAAAASGTWHNGTQSWGGAEGPQCVVCQSSPRTVLAWPCRCLSLCEDCRVSLAMNNFTTCVCCRQEVVGFSRLYVP